MSGGVRGGVAANGAENSQTHNKRKSFNIIEDKYEESDEDADENS